MCRYDVGMEPLGDIVERLLEGLAVGPKGGDRPTAAQAVEGRADIGREGRANVLRFVPRKGPGTEAPGQVEGGELHRGEEKPVTLMLAAGQRGIRGQRKLR